MERLAPNLWHWTALHPDWTPESDGWGPEVSSYACEVEDRVLVFDPLVADWEPLDGVIAGRPVTVLLTVPWHSRSTEAVRGRYPSAAPHGVEVIGFSGVGGETELIHWLPAARAIVTGDSILGAEPDGIRLAPESWFGDDGAERVTRELQPVLDLAVEHVLVTHGGPLLGAGGEALARILAG
jgi:hypothetical protein